MAVLHRIERHTLTALSWAIMTTTGFAFARTYRKP